MWLNSWFWTDINCSLTRWQDLVVIYFRVFNYLMTPSDFISETSRGSRLSGVFSCSFYFATPVGAHILPVTLTETDVVTGFILKSFSLTVDCFLMLSVLHPHCTVQCWTVFSCCWMFYCRCVAERFVAGITTAFSDDRAVSLLDVTVNTSVKSRIVSCFFVNCVWFRAGCFTTLLSHSSSCSFCFYRNL